jgi:hypothetical protein
VKREIEELILVPTFELDVICEGENQIGKRGGSVPFLRLVSFLKLTGFYYLDPPSLAVELTMEARIESNVESSISFF